MRAAEAALVLEEPPVPRQAQGPQEQFAQAAEAQTALVGRLRKRPK